MVSGFSARISKRSPPATKFSCFFEAKMTPLGFSRSISETASVNSVSIFWPMVLTDLPGTSIQTVMMPSASTVVLMVSSSRFMLALSIRALFPFQQNGRALAAADAEGGDAQVDVALVHFHQEREDEACAGGADGMAEGDAAAVDVEFFQVDFADGIVLVEMLAGEF